MRADEEKQTSNDIEEDRESIGGGRWEKRTQWQSIGKQQRQEGIVGKGMMRRKKERKIKGEIERREGDEDGIIVGG